MSTQPPAADHTALSYWFGTIMRAGLPVPKTVLLPMPSKTQRAIIAAFDGKEINGELLEFARAIDAAAAVGGIAYPLFLRTDHTSGKHDWNNTCYVSGPGERNLARHVFAIVEHSELVSIFGLPWMNWVIREMLPTRPLGRCPVYAQMPVCREFRFFVDGPEVLCCHPYWPLEALEMGGASQAKELYAALCHMDGDDLVELTALASKAGAALGGQWSVDMLWTDKGWYVTDLAEASESFHWEGCSKEALIKR